MNVVMTAWLGVRAVFLAAALLATLPGTGAAQDKSITIKLATATLNDAQHEWMKRFAVEIDKTTNGRIKSEIYPSSQLGATGIPLNLSDVLPALQQGTIDGTFSGLPVFTTLQYQSAARYMTETDQAYIFSIAVLSKRWFDGLPADLQGLVMAAAKQAQAEVTPGA